jgi:arylsulfatase A-like enzyme/Flp pilus assembly protein TadD
LTACRRQEELPRAKYSFRKERSNVLLITLDTVRADALRIYSPTGTPVPGLQELAGKSIVFENAISQIPYTLPSHSTMFTSHYPVSHGVIDNVRGLLPARLPTLAECFQKQGFETAGFVGSMVISHATEINRGFEYYDDQFSNPQVIGSSIDKVERRAEEVFLSFKQWFERRNTKKNFFAFLHFYDAHSPYEPPAPFLPEENTPKERYLGEIRYVDAILARLFNYLEKQKGAFANTIIVIEADHGEMFQEHKEMGHGFFLYEPSLHVPLIVYLPSLKKEQAQKGRIPDIVQLVDLAPTLLDLTNVSIPQSMQGESLVPLLEGKPKKNNFGFSETYMAALEVGASPIFSVQDGQYKYIETTRSELYDLRNDSAEINNLIDKRQEITKNLQQVLKQYKQKFTGSSKSQRTVTAEEAEKLAAIGYLGGDVPPEQWDKRKDPKDYVEAWTELTRIKILITRKEFDRALALIQQVKPVLRTKQNVLSLDEAECYSNAGDLKKAEQILTGLKDADTALPLAKIYLKTGRQEQAIKMYHEELNRHFELFKLYNFLLILKLADQKAEALKTLDDFKKTHGEQGEMRQFLAETSFALEQWDDVEKYCRVLIRERPWEWKWYAMLCDSYEKQKQYEKALQLLKSAQDLFAQNPAYLYRAGIFFRLTGHSGNAVRAFSRMIQLSPHDPSGYFQLAAEMVTKKYKIDDAIRYVQKGLTLRPNLDQQILAHSILYTAFQQKENLQEAKREYDLVQNLKNSSSKK